MAKYKNITSAQTDQKPSTLREIAKIVGIQGAEPTDTFKLQSQAPTDIRNESVNTPVPFSNNNPQSQLNDTEVSKQLAETLRHSGPATFRDIRDALGLDTLKAAQSAYGLTNVPQSILPPDATTTTKNENPVLTTGNTLDQTLKGFRNSFVKSLKPETPIQTARRDVIKERSKEELKTAQENQLNDQLAAQANVNQQPNFFQRAIKSIQGVGGNFFDRLMNSSPANTPAASQPTDSVIHSPDTGETLDFNTGNFLGNVDPVLRQLQNEADIAISQGADKNLVQKRLVEAYTKLKSQNKGVK